MKQHYTILIISICLLFGQDVQAQQPTIDAAIAMMTRNRPDSAILALRPLVAESASLAAPERATAYFRLSDALLREALRTKGESRNGVSAQHASLLKESSEQIQQARGLMGQDKALGKQVNEQIRKLKLELTNAANQNFQGVISAEDAPTKNTLLERNDLCTRQLLALDSSYHMAYDYLGQTLLALGDSLQALNILNKGLANYIAASRAEPDLLALPMIPRLARVQLRFLKDPVLAQKTVAEGLLRIELEEELVESNKSMTDKRREMMLQKLDKVRVEISTCCSK